MNGTHFLVRLICIELNVAVKAQAREAKTILQDMATQLQTKACTLKDLDIPYAELLKGCNILEEEHIIGVRSVL